ncbi:MAG TPA: hypothetical protein PLH94_11730 [Fimbriimonadaceae bacterium]|nr:hypothetical protein [Fimbriimonadaceae bacterium]
MPMRIIIPGGSGHVGRHFDDTSKAMGTKSSLFLAGKDPASSLGTAELWAPGSMH